MEWSLYELSDVTDCVDCRARPVPLSAFGEEGDEDLEDLPEKVPRQVPRSSTFKTDNARPSPSPGHQHQAGTYLP